jgi:LPXTG-motif cell wall-anchored protein
VHGLDYNGGDRVTLENCNIPATGGGSTSMLPFGLALLGVGAVAVLTGRRRRPMPLA